MQPQKSNKSKSKYFLVPTAVCLLSTLVPSAFWAAKFCGLQALWSSQNVFGPPTMVTVVVDFKDRATRIFKILYLYLLKCSNVYQVADGVAGAQLGAWLMAVYVRWVFCICIVMYFVFVYVRWVCLAFLSTWRICLSDVYIWHICLSGVCLSGGQILATSWCIWPDLATRAKLSRKY